MKLIDILARELKAWPMACGGDYHTEAIAQDLDGGLVRLDHLKKPDPIQFNGKDWKRSHWTGYAYYVELSDDHDTAIVTRAEWEEAVDALNAKKVGQWNGEGLPPVGTVCEFLVLRDGYSAWDKGEILYSSPYTVVISAEAGEHVYHPRNLKFRPVRTPKQIAAEEREAGIESIRQLLSNVACDDFHAAVAIYDAGYRKQEQP